MYNANVLQVPCYAILKKRVFKMSDLLHNTFANLISWIFYKDTSLHVHKVSQSLSSECSGM